MRALKYVMFLVLCVGAWEATRGVFQLDPRIHLGLASILLGYAVVTLLWLKKPATHADLDTDEPRSSARQLAKLAGRAVYLLLFRIFFLVLALAYFCKVLTLIDPGMLASPPAQRFASFVLLVFEQLFPPATALAQHIVPALRPVSLTYSSNLSVLMRVLSWVALALVIVSTLKEIWLLVYRREFKELDRRFADNTRKAVFTFRSDQ
jgi:hypothetical protein